MPSNPYYTTNWPALPPTPKRPKSPHQGTKRKGCPLHAAGTPPTFGRPGHPGAPHCTACFGPPTHVPAPGAHTPLPPPAPLRPCPHSRNGGTMCSQCRATPATPFRRVG